ncbi:MAG TPA: hypothetical protein VFO12_10370, partial [Sphingomicrobium sp.]|nr:hypothetical protein [Sphingomicrobium sp.]
MPAPIPSIVGTWVTSFIAWFPVEPWQFIPRFADTKFIKPEPGSEIWTVWEDEWKGFKSDSQNTEELMIASIKHPQPVAVLACFVFRESNFDVNISRNFIDH